MVEVVGSVGRYLPRYVNGTVVEGGLGSSSEMAWRSMCWGEGRDRSGPANHPDARSVRLRFSRAVPNTRINVHPWLRGWGGAGE